MFLFSEDEDRRVSSLLARLANYDDAIQPLAAEDGTLPSDARPQPKANLGVLTGVYLPCIQNIFGVIIFIRMAWMTGTAGVPAFFLIVLLCCAVTFCTVILFPGSSSLLKPLPRRPSRFRPSPPTESFRPAVPTS